MFCFLFATLYIIKILPIQYSTCIILPVYCIYARLIDAIVLFIFLIETAVLLIFITHASGIRAVGRVSSCLCDCVCVCTVKGKRLELSTPNLLDTQCMAVARHALTLRSKGQKSRSRGYGMCCQCGVHVDRTAEVFLVII